MVWIEIVLGLLVSIVCAWFAVRLARDKGRRPLVWGVLAFLFPVIGVFVVAMLPPATSAP